MNIESAIRNVVAARTIDARVSAIRKLPQDFGSSDLVTIYSTIARDIYAPTLDPDFAYIHWLPDYDLGRVKNSYENAFGATKGFSKVDVSSLSQAIVFRPNSLLAFRLILGLTTSEFAEATKVANLKSEHKAVSKSKIEAAENGSAIAEEAATACAKTIHMMMEGRIFNTAPARMKRKLDKPDTKEGWKTVRRFAQSGVPFDVFLHQRLYGGAFSQLLNATGALRGDSVEDAVEEVLKAHGIGYLRTGTGNQGQIRKQFQIAVQPAPDFIIHDRDNNLCGMLECKAANDGGTARDKASRFALLRRESVRLGGVPVFAVLSGLGWRRVSDALGPVVRDTEGRVFTRSTLPKLVTVQPLSSLARRKD